MLQLLRTLLDTQRKRAGLTEEQLALLLLGLFVGVIAVGATDELGSIFTDIAGSLFGIFGSYEQSAVDSARAMTYAVSCSAIINAHKPGDEVYRDQWDAPFNRQGFGSQITQSCSDAVDSPAKIGNVAVSCDSYDTENGGCEMRGFQLPQQVPYTGPDIFSGVPEEIGQWLTGYGEPKYVLYYQSLDAKVEKSWLMRTEGYNMMAIAFGGVVGALAVPGSSILKSVGRTTMGFVPSFGARAFGGTFADMASGAAGRVSDNLLTRRARFMGEALLRKTSGAVMPRLASGRAGAQLLIRGAIAKLSTKLGTGITKRQADAVLDDFVTILSRRAEESGGMRAAFEGGNTIRARPGEITIYTKSGRGAAWSRNDFQRLFRESFEEAVDNNGVRSEFTDQEIQQLAEEWGTRFINAREIGESVADRVYAEGADYGAALSGEAAWQYGFRASMIGDTMAGSIISASTRTQRRAAARQVIDKATTSARALGASTTGQIVRKGPVAAACNSQVVRSEVIETIASEFDGDELDFWSGVGRCAAFSGGADAAVKGVCQRAGVTAVRDTRGLSTTGTAACAAVTAAGHGLDWMASNAYKSVPGGVNSLYLKRAFTPPLEFKLHPVANYYFLQLDRAGNNPESRFFLAAPVFTTNVKDAEDPRIVIRKTTASTKMHSVFTARDDISGSEGPHGVIELCGELGQFQQGLKSITDVAAGVPLVGGIYDSFFGSVSGDIGGITVEEAISNGLAGTFFYDGGSLCDDELAYMKHPQVRKKPGADAPNVPPGFRSEEWHNTPIVMGPKIGEGRDVSRDYFVQLWEWRGNCETPVPGHRTGCVYTRNFPEIYGNGTGVTYYEDPKVLNDFWNGLVSAPNMGQLGHHEDMTALQVSFEGMPGDNWQTTNGNAIYGYNADIQQNQYAEAALIVGAIVLEGAAAVATGGASLVTVVAAGAGGAGGEAVVQWFTKENAWPNH